MIQSSITEPLACERSMDFYLLQTPLSALPRPAVIIHKLCPVNLMGFRPSSVDTEVEIGTAAQTFTSAVSDFPPAKVGSGDSVVNPIIAWLDEIPVSFPKSLSACIRAFPSCVKEKDLIMGQTCCGCACKVKLAKVGTLTSGVSDMAHVWLSHSRSQPLFGIWYMERRSEMCIAIESGPVLGSLVAVELCYKNIVFSKEKKGNQITICLYWFS